MALSAWLRKPTATATELAEQLEAAQEAHAEATHAVSDAEEAFDEDPTTAREKAVLAAREGEERARLHVSRAERLLSAARRREAEAETVAKRKRAAELAPLLRHEGVMLKMQPLLDRELELLEAVAKVRQQRRELHAELGGLLSEYQQIMRELGEPSKLDDRVTYATSHLMTAQAIEERIARLPHTNPLTSLLRALMPARDAYHHDITHHAETAVAAE